MGLRGSDVVTAVPWVATVAWVQPLVWERLHAAWQKKKKKKNFMVEVARCSSKIYIPLSYSCYYAAAV